MNFDGGPNRRADNYKEPKNWREMRFEMNLLATSKEVQKIFLDRNLPIDHLDLRLLSYTNELVHIINTLRKELNFNITELGVLSLHNLKEEHKLAFMLEDYYIRSECQLHKIKFVENCTKPFIEVKFPWWDVTVNYYKDLGSTIGVLLKKKDQKTKTIYLPINDKY